MSTIKSSSDHVIINADGASKDIKFQANGVEKASIDSSGNLTVSGNLTSVGIDDNATSTAITIDASEQVHITSVLGVATSLATTKTTAGLSINSTVGSSNTLDIFDNGAGDMGLSVSNGSGTGAYNLALCPYGGQVRVGAAGITFNGDTAAANALDDYEEGTFTPALSATGYTFSYTSQLGIYTKIGNLVSLKIYIRPSGQPSGSGTVGLSITGLPFTAANTYANYSGGSILTELTDDFFSGIANIRSNANSANLTIYNSIPGAHSTATFDVSKMDASDEFEISIIYHT